ncbi:MAG: LysM peptidoglycan-binding domain-containing protein, partial [Solirubrobacteraceae bacterium]
MRRLFASTLFATLAFAAPASAEVAHTVQPGETLWSIAAANNLTTLTVAAYNGLSEYAQVVLGATVRVPTTVEGYAALHCAGLVPATPGAAAAAP